MTTETTTLSNVVVKINHRISAEGHPFSETFIEYKGKHLYGRNFYLLDDTPAMRAHVAQQFLNRLKMFPSGIVR